VQALTAAAGRSVKWQRPAEAFSGRRTCRRESFSEHKKDVNGKTRKVQFSNAIACETSKIVDLQQHASLKAQ
jgi:hypothetical protein